MSIELSLRFPDPDHVIVGFDGDETEARPFADPLTPQDRKDLRWYLEVYGAHSLADPDDDAARRTERSLATWGRALFDMVATIRRIVAGERDPDDLFEGLDSEDSMIVDAILQGIDDPSSLGDLMPQEQGAP